MDEVVSMNLADLDVADLEQRLELAVASPLLAEECGYYYCEDCGSDW